MLNKLAYTLRGENSSNEKLFTKMHLVFIVGNSMDQSNCSTGIADCLLHEIY